MGKIINFTYTVPPEHKRSLTQNGDFLYLKNFFTTNVDVQEIAEAFTWQRWNKVEAPLHDRNAPIGPRPGGKFNIHKTKGREYFPKEVSDDISSQELQDIIRQWTGETMNFQHIRFMKYEKGDYCGPHADFYYSGLSLMFYFNKVWKEEWHGELTFYRDNTLVKAGYPVMGSICAFRVPCYHKTVPTTPLAEPKICCSVRWRDCIV